ncbi:uncharacterized protein EV154DRAFT_503839 [Mucor mucedo]|uniref:RRM domain-containing protein n=1 Tax=Mucor saturninus TaxID=64648 RepID=A0A8H7QHY7_9FUNG|nr:uncharacterized protein EV154DRAFT_503839 [Mucor mucedo]KAG2192529.1 hypothetical protein INT47_006005 [Mucor saturninus]KAI7892698.1 hypothetical protein EV154DRAFT_503839 [Mucor mucedo]
MSTTLKTVATETVKKSFTPSRTFFRLSETIPSIQHARAVFKTLGSYGEMVEYKVMRCPETLKYLRYGFVVYKNKDDANKAVADQFVKVQSELFDKPVDIKIEKAVSSSTFKNTRKNDNYNKKQRQ